MVIRFDRKHGNLDRTFQRYFAGDEISAIPFWDATANPGENITNANKRAAVSTLHESVISSGPQLDNFKFEFGLHRISEATAIYFDSNCFRNSVFKIFPVALRGRAGEMITWRGTL